LSRHKVVKTQEDIKELFPEPPEFEGPTMEEQADALFKDWKVDDDKYWFAW